MPTYVIPKPEDALYPGATTYPGVDAIPSDGGGLNLAAESPDTLILTEAPHG